MKKTLLFVVALLCMAAPVMAASDITITCTPGTGTDCNLITISYLSDTNYIRAFGLDITADDANIVEVIVLEPDYRIYPGQIDIIEGEVDDYGQPYAPGDIGDKDLTIEMGSLYTMDANYAGDPNMGYGLKPPLSGDLLSIRTDGDCTVTVDVNVARGGIVMEDAYETPIIDTPLCTAVVECEVVQPTDFGDAPDTYPTMLPNGPSHVITGTPPLTLGATIDPEPDGQPSVGAVLDDTNNTGSADDEDGVTIATLIAPGSVTVNASAACLLNAWMDFNGDGDFADAGEAIFVNTALVAGNNVLAVTVPAGTKQSLIYSRWRVNAVGGLSYTGPAADGEVEDYATECLKSTDPGYTAWKNTWGMPRCWCCKKQCRGDINCASSLSKPVTTADLGIMKSAFGQTDAVLATIPNGICADLNHAASLGKRVTTADLNILKSYFGIAEASVPQCASTNIMFWTN